MDVKLCFRSNCCLWKKRKDVNAPMCWNSISDMQYFSFIVAVIMACWLSCTYSTSRQPRRGKQSDLALQSKGLVGATKSQPRSHQWTLLRHLCWRNMTGLICVVYLGFSSPTMLKQNFWGDTAQSLRQKCKGRSYTLIPVSSRWYCTKENIICE